MLVLHYTGMPTGQEALDWLRNPKSQVSAHYLIEEDGRIFGLVAEDRRAWHAGISHWRGGADVNDRSIGIELVNPGHEFGYRDFAAPQIESLVALSQDILTRHPIPARNLVGHSDVAPGRKTDPGERFPWRDLAAAGVGLWPQAARVASPIASEDIADLLRHYGYGLDGVPPADVIAAFQRHFRPKNIDGIGDAETLGLLSDLISKVAEDAPRA